MLDGGITGMYRDWLASLDPLRTWSAVLNYRASAPYKYTPEEGAKGCG